MRGINSKNYKNLLKTTFLGLRGGYNEAEKSKLPELQGPELNVQQYIPNFNFLAQFGGELWEEETQSIRKRGQKTTLLGYEEHNGSEKLKPQKDTFMIVEKIGFFNNQKVNIQEFKGKKLVFIEKM